MVLIHFHVYIYIYIHMLMGFNAGFLGICNIKYIHIKYKS